LARTTALCCKRAPPGGGGPAASGRHRFAIACLLAAMLALVREGSSFADGFRISVWLVGCVCVLLAFAGSSTTMRSGTVDPLAASFFPKLRPGMSEAASGIQVSSGALFVLTALVLFGLGVALG
jgi:hypothetical protein